jgi:hypothetical protein
MGPETTKGCEFMYRIEFGGGGEVTPGVSRSPACAGTLSAKARIAAVHIGFKVFIVSPKLVFGLAKAVEHKEGRPLRDSNEAHNIHRLTSVQGFLQLTKRTASHEITTFNCTAR